MDKWYFQHRKETLSIITSIFSYIVLFIVSVVIMISKDYYDSFIMGMNFVFMLISLLFKVLRQSNKQNMNILSFNYEGIDIRRWFRKTHINWGNVYTIKIEDVLVDESKKYKTVEKLVVYSNANTYEGCIVEYLDNRPEILDCISMYYELQENFEYNSIAN